MLEFRAVSSVKFAISAAVMRSPEVLPRCVQYRSEEVGVGDIDRFCYDIIKLNRNPSALEGRNVGLY